MCSGGQGSGEGNGFSSKSSRDFARQAAGFFAPGVNDLFAPNPGTRDFITPDLSSLFFDIGQRGPDAQIKKKPKPTVNPLDASLINIKGPVPPPPPPVQEAPSPRRQASRRASSRDRRRETPSGRGRAGTIFRGGQDSLLS